MHVHDLDPAMLDLLGIEHMTLTFHLQGCDFRVTDIRDRGLSPILAYLGATCAERFG